MVIEKRKNNSGHYGEGKAVSDMHFRLGKAHKSTNIDCLEYKYVNGKRIRVAVIDYKYGTQKEGQYPISLADDAMQCQLELANDLNLPFFIVITFLDTNVCDVPMYYVIYANNLAKSVFDSVGRRNNGYWFSVRDYAKFQCLLRHIEPDENEIKWLSSIRKTSYTLPKININL